ncbi:calmodulin binding protein2, partial [Zea mays]
MQTYNVGEYESRWIQGHMDFCSTVSRNRFICVIISVIVQLH